MHKHIRNLQRRGLCLKRPNNVVDVEQTLKCVAATRSFCSILTVETYISISLYDLQVTLYCTVKETQSVYVCRPV